MCSKILLFSKSKADITIGNISSLVNAKKIKKDNKTYIANMPKMILDTTISSRLFSFMYFNLP